jgi:UDP:flavonoid glycosyltransferase YjiC (YdhE family)
MRVLFAWELGEGFGHLAGCAPLLRELRHRGHQVTAVVKDTALAAPLLPGDCRILPSPVPAAAPPRPVARPMTFAHVLHNNGFHCGAVLARRAAAWRALVAAERPDLILAEHSPTALMAAGGLPGVRVVIGTGFTCPPDLTPLPCLRPWLCHDPGELARDEGRVLAAANTALEALGRPPLPTLARLFADADATLLRTFRELDHYPARAGGHYRGTATSFGGLAPEWGGRGRPRVFAYLKPGPCSPELLAELGRASDVLAFVPGLPHADVRRVRAAGVRLANRPVDMAAAVSACDLAVLNGTHGATAAALLAGKPVVQLPIYLEQVLIGLRTEALGAGRIASRADPAAVARTVREVWEDPRYRAAARRIADRYYGFSADRTAADITNRLERLPRPSSDPVCFVSTQFSE